MRLITEYYQNIEGCIRFNLLVMVETRWRQIHYTCMQILSGNVDNESSILAI